MDGVWVEVPKASDFVTFSASSPLSFNPSTGALSMVTHAYQAYDANMIAWPVAVSATELAYAADGATSNLQAQINSLSVAGFSPAVVTTSPTTASTTGTYINTTNGHFYIVNSSGILDIAGTWTAAAAGETGLIDLDGVGIPENWVPSSGVSFDSTEEIWAGHQSLSLPLSAASPYADLTIPSSGDTWVHFMYQSNSTIGSYRPIFRAYSEATNTFTVSHMGSNVRITSGAVSTTAAFTITPGSTYHFWIHLNAATKVGDVYVGSTTTRPALLASATGAQTETTIDRLRWTDVGFAGSGIRTLAAHILVSGAEISEVEP